jgi:mycothiol synthase
VAVRPLDASALSEELMRRVYDLMVLCHEEESAEEPFRTMAEAESFLRHVADGETRDYWIAESGCGCVGFAQLAVLHGSSTGRVDLLVRPDARHRGHGTALLDTVREQAAKRGAEVLTGRHATEAGSRFAAAARAVDKQREVHSLLRLPLAPHLTTRPVGGYAVRSWVGAAPAPLVDSFARARRAINDAPGFDETPEVWDAARVRDLEAALERRNRDIRVTVALDEQDEVVAFTGLRVSQTRSATAGTEDTAVVASHRRKGLARWVKLESFLRLQQDRPDVTLVTTSNAEENDAMLTLNRALGFSPVAVYTTCALQL